TAVSRSVARRVSAMGEYARLLRLSPQRRVRAHLPSRTDRARLARMGKRATADRSPAALIAFTEYVAKNYPPNTLISDPLWHAPRLFRAAERAMQCPTATDEKPGSNG